MKRADGSEAAVPNSAAMLFSDVMPEDERPTRDNRVLEVVMVWSNTIINVKHLRPGKGRVTLGPVGGKYDFVVSGDFMPGDEWTLVESQGDEFVIRSGGDLRLEARRGTVGGESHTLGLEDQVVVHAGEVDFVIRYVRESKRLATNVWNTVDFYFTKVFSTSLVAHAAFFIALLLTPIHTSEISEDLFANPNRFAKLIIEPEDDAPKKKKFEELSELKEEDQREEVKFGEKVELKEDLPDKKGAPVVDVDKREQDKKKVMKTGLLAALDSGGPGSGSNIFSGGLGTGINNALGGLQNGAGDAMGVGGMGARGVGPGGGGAGLGIGGLGTKGGGGGGGKGYGAISIGDRGRKRTQINSGQMVTVGGMDKEVIARIVRKHQNEIKFCYERELQKDPNLYGKVAVMWVIDPTGGVATTSIAQTTMGNSNVENCILQRVKRWKFPQPKGGGVVQVTYPWIFKPSG